MNKPIDPIKVRQARQGKPVLAILAVSMVLAIIAGGVLWGIITEETGSSMADGASLSLQHSTPDAPSTL